MREHQDINAGPSQAEIAQRAFTQWVVTDGEVREVEAELLEPVPTE